jgi:hypothetical protein
MLCSSVLGEDDLGYILNFLPGFFGKNSADKNIQRDEGKHRNDSMFYPAIKTNKRPDNEYQSNQT